MGNITGVPEVMAATIDLPGERPSVDHKVVSDLHRSVQNEAELFLRHGRRIVDGMPDGLSIELYTSNEISPDLVREVSDTFRYTFNNSFPEYVLCRDCQEQTSAIDLYGVTDGSYLPLAQLDNPNEMPACGGCHQPMEFFHDPVKTQTKLASRLGAGANLALLRNEEGNSIDGFSFGYKRTLKDVFLSEWKFLYSYCAQEDPRYVRDYDLFLEKTMPLLSASCGRNIGPDDDVYCWNCVAIGKKMQGKKLLPKLLGCFSDDISHEMVETLPVIGETIDGSRFYQILSRAGLTRVDDVLGNGLVLMAGPLKGLVEKFKSPPDKF
ncbi:hypothetical protein IT413_06025 [Candidatus Peregrinibacteria bacterium]|nr:hypothetical protein [Candidatus Peregrinibacteria bacterium]